MSFEAPSENKVGEVQDLSGHESGPSLEGTPPCSRGRDLAGSTRRVGRLVSARRDCRRRRGVLVDGVTVGQRCRLGVFPDPSPLLWVLHPLPSASPRSGGEVVVVSRLVPTTLGWTPGG